MAVRTVYYLLLIVPVIFQLIQTGKIKIKDPKDITGTNCVDFYLPSYPVVVVGKTGAIDFFDGTLKSALLEMVLSLHSFSCFNFVYINLLTGQVKPGVAAGITIFLTV
jgi:hypothetical protein